MVDHVVARDGTCRGIGCRVSADRVRPGPHPALAGRGHRGANLHPVHRFHHRIKTLTDTTVHVDPDGTTVWTLPSGRTYRVPPHQVLDHPDLDPPALPDHNDWRDAIRQSRQSHQDRDRDQTADPRPTITRAACR